MADKRKHQKTQYEELCEKNPDQLEGYKLDRFGRVRPKPSAHYGGIRSTTWK